MRVAVVGAGGHGKVVADAILLEQAHDLAGFLDDAPGLAGLQIWGYPILGSIASWREHGVDALVLAIGHNARRQALFEELGRDGARIVGARHPRTTVGRGATLADGVVMLAHAVVNADSIIGPDVILNTASTVDHDCDVRAHAHLGPGVHLAGGVRIGDGAFLGIGAVVLPGIAIGARAIIGAGAVVTRDVAAGSTVVGVPGRRR